MRHLHTMAGLAITGAACSVCCADPTTLTFIGKLPGQTGSRGMAVSADGYVVAGTAATAEGGVAIRWALAAGMVSLGVLPGDVNSEGICISGDGRRISGRSNGLMGSRAFMWSSQGGMTAFTGNDPFHDYVSGFAANTDVVVGEALNLVPDAARWLNGGADAPLGGPVGGFGTGARTAFACSQDGSVVVGRADTPTGYHAFRWTQAGGYQDLGVLAGGSLSSAYGVSRNGLVVVGSSTDAIGAEQAFKWTAGGGMQRLTTSVAYQGSIALSTSADGLTIVGICYQANNNGPPYTSPPNQTGFMWNNLLGFQNMNAVLVSNSINTSGMSLLDARSISDDGKVIAGTGSYQTPNAPAHVEGYMLRLAGARPLCPADMGVQGGSAGHDGLLDNNDFVAFINLFFVQDSRADIGVQGGLHGSDNHWDNNDFVVFISDFFMGCP